MPFTVTKFPNVKHQIQALMKRAAAIGLTSPCIDALTIIERKLQNWPLEWGDPDFNLNHADAVVCHAIEHPFVVRFAVYEVENVVCVIDIRALPTSPLAES